MTTRRSWLAGLVLAAAAAVAAVAVFRCSADGPATIPVATQPADLVRLAGGAQAGVPASAPATQANSADAFRFIIVGDRTGGVQPGAWEAAVGEINLLRPDFAITTGDMVEGITENAEQIQAEWKEFDRITAGLEVPFFRCPGNHDVWGDAGRRIYTKLHGRDGRTYYSFDYRSCHFVVIDSSMLMFNEDGVDRHWEWLQADLKAARQAKHTFMFMHHPLYVDLVWPRLRAMLDVEKTTLFAGHWHQLTYGREQGAAFYVLGPTAARSAPEMERGLHPMYAHVSVSDGKPRVSIIPLGCIRPGEFNPRPPREETSASAPAEPATVPAP